MPWSGSSYLQAHGKVVEDGDRNGNTFSTNQGVGQRKGEEERLEGDDLERCLDDAETSR